MLQSHEARTVIYQRHVPRWVHLACLVPTIGLTATMFWLVFLQPPGDDALIRAEEIDTTGRFIFGFFVLAGFFLTGVFAYRLLRNPPYFILYDTGFEYSPGGVSTGLIRWSEVAELRDETVLQGDSGPGSGRGAVTAVVLHSPEEYIARFPAALEPLFRARLAMNSSPILISKAEFGRDHDTLLGIMREQVAKARQR